MCEKENYYYDIMSERIDLNNSIDAKEKNSYEISKGSNSKPHQKGFDMESLESMKTKEYPTQEKLKHMSESKAEYGNDDD